MRNPLLFLPLLLVLGCPPSPVPPTPNPDDPDASVDDAGDEADGSTDVCRRAELKLLKLGCKDSRDRLIGGPNLHGTPWRTICRDNKKNGVDMHPSCIATQTACQGVETCR